MASKPLTDPPGKFNTYPLPGVPDYGEALTNLKRDLLILEDAIPLGDIDRTANAMLRARRAFIQLESWIDLKLEGRVRMVEVPPPPPTHGGRRRIDVVSDAAIDMSSPRG